jgi:hypothetical protein
MVIMKFKANSLYKGIVETGYKENGNSTFHSMGHKGFNRMPRGGSLSVPDKVVKPTIVKIWLERRWR